MNAVSIKEVKKGTRVRLANGWEAEAMDNKTNGHTRMLKVFGDYVEMGSVYTTDIKYALVNGEWAHVNHSPSQVATFKRRQAWGF